MISETGENLTVIVRTQTGEDWRAFATWYSVQKNLPDAAVSILCHRTVQVQFQFYQWAKRLQVPIRFVNPFYRDHTGDWLYDLKTAPGSVVLMLDYTCVVTDILSPLWLDRLNDSEPALFMDQHAIIKRRVANESLDSILDKFAFTGQLIPPAYKDDFIPQAKDSEEPECVVSCSKGCGKWIDKLKGCPFSNADGLIVDDMTVNEMRIVQLWRKMVALFSAVN